MASLPSRFREILSAFNFQPSTFRWAALAAVWLVIFALNYAARDTSPAATAEATPPSPEMIMAIKEQRRELAQLVGLDAPAVVPEPKPFFPRPRSDLRREGIMMT